MSIVREAQETYIEYSSLYFRKELISTDGMHSNWPFTRNDFFFARVYSDMYPIYKYMHDSGIKPIKYVNIADGSYTPATPIRPIIKFL